MSIKPITDLFPLIDDPANQFYSKLKSQYASFMEAKAELKRNSRTKYTITVSYPNVSEPLVRVIDVRELKQQLQALDTTDKSPFLYAKVLVTKKIIATEETTTAGENIPVNEYSLTCEVNNTYYFLDYSIQLQPRGESLSKVLIEEVNNKVYVHIRVCSISTSYLLLGTDLEPEKEDYASLYKPEIGRRWQIGQVGNNLIWNLYAIDSDFEEILIDSSTVEFTPEKLPAPQMAPYIDHRVSLCFELKTTGRFNDFYIYEKEYLEDYIHEKTKYSHSTNYQRRANMKMYHRAESVLYSAHSWEHLEYLFSSIKFREINTGSDTTAPFGTTLKREMVFLALSYITGLNIRFFFKDFEDYTCEFIFDTHDSSPTRIQTSAFDSGSELLQSSIQEAYGMTTWSYDSTGHGDYTPVPVLQNTLGFSTRTVYDRYFVFNEKFLYRMRDGMKLLDQEAVQYDAENQRTGLSFRSRFGDDPAEEDSGYKDMLSYIEYLPYLYSEIGGSFSNSWFNTTHFYEWNFEE